jgi:phosphoglycerate dehydrogenase-like enzyme
VFDGLCRALTAKGYRFVRLPSHRELLAQPALLAGLDVLAGFGNMPIDAGVLRAAVRLRGVVSSVSGTDGYDLKAASAQGVLVAHAPTHANARGMAEAAMLLLLHLAYDMDGTRDDLRFGRPRPLPVRAQMLHGKRIGLVGWGRISANLAALLQPWGVQLDVYSRRGTPADLPAHAHPVSLEELLSGSDFVCVLAGAEANMPPVINRQGLALIKRSARLINLSRGAVVDEAALIDALQSGRIAGAALDVFAVEPLPMDSPLRSLQNVILTPHHVGHTQEGDRSLIPAIIDNVMALLQGEVPPMVRNPEATGRWLERFGGRPCERQPL